MRTFHPATLLHLAPIAMLGLTRAAAAQGASSNSSTLETIAVPDYGHKASGEPHQQRPHAVYTAKSNFEAPNWTHDGSSLIFDGGGKLYRVPVAGGSPEPISIGEGMHCNGSHGLSPDGTLLAISCSTTAIPGSHVYVVPVQGGIARLITPHPASYFHTWSPDGKTIVFTRPDHNSLNLLAIDLLGGSERPLTTGTGVSDDPDFSPDGRFLYFCSDRGGTMQIWRMRADGSQPEQITSDHRINWTPHPSPDGRWIVFLSYAPKTAGHPANQPVQLRLMSVKDRQIIPLVSLTGGAGTINVPSWAPDSHHLAYVSYQEELP